MRKLLTQTVFAITVISFSGSWSSNLTAQVAPGATALQPYLSCQFSDGLQIVETDPLAPGITSRAVDTDTGPRQIDLEAGVRVMFAYPGTDFYANVKAELLPAANYPRLKRSLLDNFDHLTHGNIVNAAQRTPLNGFEVRGLDRERLEGGVLGIYLLFDDSAHVVTTIYMLNQEPQDRQFQTMEEYRALRDHFLAAYTACIRKNQQGGK